MPMLSQFTNDIVGCAVSVALAGGYYVYLHWRTAHHDRLYTVQAINAEARRLWVDSVMAERRDILAVQTLRNSTMAATFLASTAVLLIIGVLSLADHGRDFEHALHALNVTGAVDPGLWIVKLLALVLDLCLAFFSFTQAVRAFNHTGYLLNVPLAAAPKIVTPGYVSEVLNRAARHYSVGMRAYYFTVPLLFWLFGPHLMVAATAGLVLLLYRIDRAPDAGN